jgi:D-alanyl-lipoteichoic acid acyltransferase DltB (MBOAT superfamily)
MLCEPDSDPKTPNNTNTGLASKPSHIIYPCLRLMHPINVQIVQIMLLPKRQVLTCIHTYVCVTCTVYLFLPFALLFVGGAAAEPLDTTLSARLVTPEVLSFFTFAICLF